MDDLKDWIRERRGLLIAGLFAIAMASGGGMGRPISQPPGILAPLDPVQTETGNPRLSWNLPGPPDHAVWPASRSGARVLSTERYPLSTGPRSYPPWTSPWAGAHVPIPDPGGRFTNSGSGDRWYFWSSSNMPIPASEVISPQARNMHMNPVPTSRWRERCSPCGRAQLLELRGQLIRANGKNGWAIGLSSLSRTDTGDGSLRGRLG